MSQPVRAKHIDKLQNAPTTGPQLQVPDKLQLKNSILLSMDAPESFIIIKAFPPIKYGEKLIFEELMSVIWRGGSIVAKTSRNSHITFPAQSSCSERWLTR